MATILRSAPDTTIWPQYPIQPAGAALAAIYGQLVEAERRTLSDFFSPQSVYSVVPELIEDARSVNARPELTEGLEVFYTSLEQLYSYVQPGEWRQILAAVAEQAVRELLEAKYPGRVAPDDKCIDVYATSSKTPPPIITMYNYSFDAVAWDVVHDCGELHEVKACITNFDGAAKIRAMLKFKQDILAHTKGQIWVGLASFLDSLSAAEDKMRALLGSPDDESPFGLDFLVPETFAMWEKQRCL